MKYKLFLYIGILFFWKTISGQELNDYLQIAENSSPEIVMQQLQFENALEKVNEVGSLSNTEIGLGVFAQSVETRVGAQQARFSARQKIPWFGTFALQEESARASAEAKESELELAKRQLALQVKLNYYELYSISEKQELIKEHITILQTYEELALSELENNRGNMVDVLKIKMKKNALQQQLTELQLRTIHKKNEFNILLNRPLTTEIAVADTLIITEDFYTDSQEKISNNPKLAQLDALQRSKQQAELAVKKEGNPSLGFGLDYVIVAERAGMTIPDNGKDVIMPMVTLSIPLFSKKHVSKQKQLQLEQETLLAQKQSVTNQLKTAYEKALLQLQIAKADISTQNENIKQAQQAQEVILTAYQTATMDFEQLLALQQLKLSFELKRIDDVYQYFEQKAIIDYITND